MAHLSLDIPRINTPALVLSAILGLSATLRLVGLGAESLWGDELVSVFLLRRHWLEILTGRLEFNQPFYYLIMHFWARAFGESEFSLRFPSAAFGVATVFVTFMLARHLVNVWIALGATLLVAVSPVLIWYSQEARLYAFTTFLLLVSTYLLIRYLETARTPFLLAYAGTAFVGFATHYYFLPFVVAHNLVAIVWLANTRRWGDLIKWLAAQLIVPLVLFIRISALLEDVAARGENAFTIPPASFLLQFISAVGLSDPDLGGPLSLVIAVWTMVILACAVAIWRRDKITVLITVCLLATIQFAVGGLFFGLPLAMRYMVPTIPLWMTITCYGFAWLTSKLALENPLARLSLVTLGVGLVLGLTLASWNQQLITPTKQQWREAAIYVESEALPSDVLYVLPSRQFRQLDFYLERPDWKRLENFQCSEDRRVWLVGRQPWIGQATRDLEQSCSRISTKAFVAITTTLFGPSREVIPDDPEFRCQGLVPTILGSAGDERINGTRSNDVIHALQGDDIINGGPGDDILCGGGGDDLINGRDGNDIIYGNEGNDILNSGPGDDSLDGGEGFDKCRGRGNDRKVNCESN
jgi:mannosyltransferase